MNNKRIIIIGNGGDYYHYCWGDAIQKKLVSYWEYEDLIPSRFLRKLYGYTSQQYLWFFNLIHSLIVTFIIHKLEINKTDDCLFILYDWSYLAKDKLLIRNLKKFGKVIYRLTNPLNLSGAHFHGIDKNWFSDFNLVVCYDKKECDNYGFTFHPLIFEPSLMQIPTQTKLKSDLFFIGDAKDRLDKIHKIFKIAKNQGLTCDFHIINVPPEKQLLDYPSEISYNKRLCYADCLKGVLTSKCILEVTQGDTVSPTLRIKEAICLKKKIITTNPFIYEEYKDELGDMISLFDQDCNLNNFINKSVSRNIIPSNVNRSNHLLETIFHHL